MFMARSRSTLLAVSTYQGRLRVRRMTDFGDLVAGLCGMELATLVQIHFDTIQSAIRATSARWRVADRDDFAMDVWVCLLRDDGRVLRRFEGRSAMGTYLFRVLHRAAGKWVGRGKRNARVELPSGDTYVAFDGGESHAFMRTLGQHQTDRDERVHILEQALSMLPERDRALLALRRQGLSNAEIARIHKTTSDAIDLRIRRAIARLRAAVGTGRKKPLQSSVASRA